MSEDILRDDNHSTLNFEASILFTTGIFQECPFTASLNRLSVARDVESSFASMFIA
ncbi:MAG: hypothetical protein ACP5LN_11200 [Thermoproteota archaeon]